MATKPAKRPQEQRSREKRIPRQGTSGLLFEIHDGDDDTPVECLGITFQNDAARRHHFLELLREKLKDPEFRRIEGFPTGEDEDILAMSDPPYYTACPNPFLDQFVAHYTTPYDPSTDTYKRPPFSADVREGKNDPLYTAHAYHTKVPHKAIMRYLLHYTNPGDIVFDGFCGTGMTGVAAQLCGDQREVESLGYQVSTDGHISEVVRNLQGQTVNVPTARLGTRKAVLNDLSPIATFIAANYGLAVNAAEFKAHATQLLSEIESEFGWMFETLHRDGTTKGRIDYTVWSDVLSCGECGQEIVFVEHALDRESGQVLKSFPCPDCGVETRKKDLTLLYDTKFDKALGAAISLPKRVPVLIHYTAQGRKYEKQPDAGDLALLRRIDELPLPPWLPTVQLPEMQMRRVGRMQPANITHLHHFFLPAATHVLSALWERASGHSDRRLKNMLLFFVEQAIWGMSVLARYVPTHYSQVNQYLSGVFYVASQIVAPSPGYVLGGKLKRLAKAFASHPVANGNLLITTQDLAAADCAAGSIDYIFTDPPFGENIYYSDLNILIESWHGVRTAPAQEAIVDRVKGKTLRDYQQMMRDCFRNYYRVLKPGRWMTVEFHNSRNSVWNSIQEALQHAGFVVADVRTLDKKQGSFQQIVSGNTVKRDLIISAYKPSNRLADRFKENSGAADGVWEFVTAHLQQLPLFVTRVGYVEPVAERESHLLFDRMVAFHVQRGVPVPLSAPEFRAAVHQKFPKRDGMYFLPEQIAEYDRERSKVERVAQLELFVSDEASAIRWVKRQVQEKPQTFRELHPPFMRELTGWEKHEQTFELVELLEQNCICYDGEGPVPSQIHDYLSSNFKGLRDLDKDDSELKAQANGRWYLPDPRREIDLEKIRHRALMEEFNTYKEGTGKLTAVRTEALRAGFAICWQKNDYQTILLIAERVKQTIIQEDPTLLMYYDNAQKDNAQKDNARMRTEG